MNILKTILSKLKPKEIEVNAEILKKSIANHFVTHLRNEGWKGSGFHFYRKKENQIIELISIYPNKYGGEFYVEVGVHFEFIELDVPCEIKKMTTGHVDIRKRLISNDNSNDAWQYPNTTKGLIILNDNLINAYSKTGDKFFRLFNNWQKELTKIQKEDIENYNGDIPFPTKTRTARILAFINLNQDKAKEAKELAEYGLSLIKGPNGSALIHDFDEIIKCI